MFVNSSNYIISMQIIYTLLSSFLVFLIIYNLSLTYQELSSVFKMLIIIGIINALAGYFQWIFLDYHIGDDIHGFSKDAHIYANYLYILVYFLAARILYQRSFKIIPLAIFFWTAAILGSHQKADLFTLAILGAFFLSQCNISKKARVWGGIFVMGCIVVVLIIMNSIDSKLLDRIMLMTNYASIEDVGIIFAYLKSFYIFQESWKSLLIGVGPGNYGDPVMLVKEISSYLMTDFGGRIVGAFDVATTQLSTIFIEFGPVAFALFIGVIISFFKFLFNLRKIIDSQFRWLVDGSIMYLSLTMLMASLTILASFESLTLTWPFMILIAGLYSLNYPVLVEAEHKTEEVSEGSIPLSA
jgi:hypothetical protein